MHCSRVLPQPVPCCELSLINALSHSNFNISSLHMTSETSNRRVSVTYFSSPCSLFPHMTYWPPSMESAGPSSGQLPHIYNPHRSFLSMESIYVLISTIVSVSLTMFTNFQQSAINNASAIRFHIPRGIPCPPHKGHRWRQLTFRAQIPCPQSPRLNLGRSILHRFRLPSWRFLFRYPRPANRVQPSPCECPHRHRWQSDSRNFQPWWLRHCLHLDSPWHYDRSSRLWFCATRAGGGYHLWIAIR